MMSESHPPNPEPLKPDPMKPVEIPRNKERDSNSAQPREAKTHLAVMQRYRQLRKKRYSAVLGLLLFMVIAFAITLGVYQSIQTRRRQTSVKNNEPKKEKYYSPETIGNEFRSQESTPQEQQPLAEKSNQTLPNGDAQLPSNEKKTNPSPQEMDSAQELRISRILRQAQKTIANRKFERTEYLLNEAKRLAGTNAEHLSQIDSVDVLRDYSQQFWEAFNDGFSTLEDSEIVVDGERMYVVQCDEEKIVLRRQGKNIRIARDSLSSKMTLLIASRGFDDQAPSTKVFKGVFMLMSPDFTDEQVRSIWQEAEGEGVDVSVLLPLLKD